MMRDVIFSPLTVIDECGYIVPTMSTTVKAKLIRVRVTVEEKKIFERRARQLGLNLSAYLRHAARFYDPTNGRRRSP